MKNIFLLFLYSFCLSSFAEIAGADQAGAVAENTDVIDRNDNAGQMASKDVAGRIMANLTGAALTAKAIPLLASPWPPDVAAGVQLLTMAGMEFSQGQVNDIHSAAQWGQQGVLSFDENQPQNSIVGSGGSLISSNGVDSTITPTTNPNNPTNPGNRVEEIVNTINTPAFQEAIASLGQDPNDFAQKLALGEIQNDSQTAQALGLSPSSSDMAASQDVKNQVLAEVFGKAPDSQSTEKVENLDLAQRGLASIGSSPGVTGTSDLESGKKSDLNLSSFFSSNKESVSEKMKDSWKSGLLDAGIQRGSKYLNIFQKASMNYKKYSSKKSANKSVKLKSRS